MKSLLLVPLLVLAGCFFRVLTAADTPQSAPVSDGPYQAENRSDPWWVKRHQDLLQRTRSGQVDLLFLGDSITQGWDCRFMLDDPPAPGEGAGRLVWDRQFAPRRAANFGLGGDGIQHLLWRLGLGGEIDGLAPRAVVLLIGTNNLAGGDPPDLVARGIGQVVKVLGGKLPQAKILLLGIFPREEKPTHRLRELIAQTNALIAKLDDGKRVVFLDLGRQFLKDDGILSAEIMFDFLHPTPKGYEIWAQAIGPVIDRLLAKTTDTK
jgi:lysophospholipase L1-like esterase